MHTTHITQISFPEINLRTRDAHKLRGFFGNYFKEYSPLLHNHLEGDKFKYGYPLVQYKVLNNVPFLIGLKEGAELLKELFLKIDTLTIDGENYPVYAKNIEFKKVEIGVMNNLYAYQFQTLWMALNEENYRLYLGYEKERQREQLEGILKRNISNALKAMGFPMTKETPAILARMNTLREETTRFKGNSMLAFRGEFITNVLLPDNIGLGKSPARGLGAIRRSI